MRVIAGVARGRPLKGPRGEGTRPTSDKVKGAIFSMLETFLAAIADRAGGEEEPPREGAVGEEAAGPSESVWSGLRVLDLYAGTGALGIEALSRGAAAADFVDSSVRCQRLIRENLQATGLSSRGRVIPATAQQVVGSSPASLGPGSYDVVLMDAPYGDPSLEAVLTEIGRSGLLSPSALVVVEHSRRGRPAEAYPSLRLVERRRHGDTEVSIYLAARSS